MSLVPRAYALRPLHLSVGAGQWERSNKSSAPPDAAAPSAARLEKTSAILQQLAVRRVKELATLEVGRSSGGQSSGGSSGGAVRSSKRSARRQKKASPYSKKSPKKAVVQPGPPTTGLSSELGVLALGSVTRSRSASAGGKFAPSVTGIPKKKAKAEADVIHFSGEGPFAVAARGCGGASGPIQRQLRNEERYRPRDPEEKRERERRRAVREAASATIEGLSDPAGTPAGCSAAKVTSFAPSRSLTGGTSSSQAKVAIGFKLPPLPTQAKRKPRFKPGFEGLDSLSP